MAAAAPASRPAPSGSSSARANDPDRAIVVNGDEGDPGSYIDKLLMERNPELLLEGMALAGYAVGARQGFVFVRSEYPRSTPLLREAVDAGPRSRRPRRGHPRQRLLLRRRDRGGRGLLRGRRGDRAARLAPGLPRHRVGAPAVPGRARLARQADRGPQRRDALQRALHRAARQRGLRGAQPGRHAGHQARVPERPLRAPRHVRGPLRHARRRDLLGAGRRARGRPRDQGGADRRPARRHPARAGSSTRRFDFDELAAEGCMVGHGGILAFDERTDMRALARHLLEFGAHESCGKCFPCRIGLQRAFEMVDRPGDVDRARLEALLETLELGSLCAHGGGMPAPIRSLIEHFPDELGLAGGELPAEEPDDPYSRRPEERRDDDPGRPMRVEIDGQAVEVEPGATILDAARAADRYVPTLCFDERHGALRRLPRLHGRDGGRRGAGGRLHHAVPRRHAGAHRGRDRAPRGGGHGGARALRAARAARRAHRARPGGGASSRSASRAGRASAAARPTTERHPYLALQHELCISCGRCVRACDEVQGAFALTATGADSIPGSRPVSTPASWTRPACPAAPAPTPAPPTRSRSTRWSRWRGVH